MHGGYQRVSREFELFCCRPLSDLICGYTLTDYLGLYWLCLYLSVSCRHFPVHVSVFVGFSWISFVLKSFGLRRCFLFGTMCNWISPWKLKSKDSRLFVHGLVRESHGKHQWDQHCACEASLGSDIEEALRSSQALTTSAQTLQDGRNGVPNCQVSPWRGPYNYSSSAQYPFLAEHVCSPWKPSDLRWMAIHGYWFSLDWTMTSCPQLSIACALLRNAFWKDLCVTAHTNMHTDTNATVHLHFALLR